MFPLRPPARSITRTSSQTTVVRYNFSDTNCSHTVFVEMPCPLNNTSSLRHWLSECRPRLVLLRPVCHENPTNEDMSTEPLRCLNPARDLGLSQTMGRTTEAYQRPNFSHTATDTLSSSMSRFLWTLLYQTIFCAKRSN